MTSLECHWGMQLSGGEVVARRPALQTKLYLLINIVTKHPLPGTLNIEQGTERLLWVTFILDQFEHPVELGRRRRTTYRNSILATRKKSCVIAGTEPTNHILLEGGRIHCIFYQICSKLCRGCSWFFRRRRSRFKEKKREREMRYEAPQRNF